MGKWPHLEDKSLDERFRVVGSYLKDRVKNKVILDLNCGLGRFVEFIPQTFKLYYGNDIEKEYIKKTLKGKNIKFELKTDFETLEFFKNQDLDILVCFGMSVGHITKHEWESYNEYFVIHELVRHKKPEIIVLESCEAYYKDFKIIDSYINAWPDYKVVKTAKIKVEGSPNIHEREIVILEKK